MHDSDIEGLLKKYRPAAPPEALETRIFQLADPGAIRTTTARTWPWAVAAAALLALTIGLHAFSLTGPAGAADQGLDVQRVQMLAAEIGGPGARATAEYIVRQEQRADAAADQARMTEASRDTVSR